MKKLLRLFVLAFLIGIFSLGIINPVKAAPSDTELLKEGVAAWAKGWSSGDNRFTMNRVADLYEHSDRFLEFNTISPADTVTKGYQNFQALWEPTMQESTHAYTTLDDDIQVITDGKIGLTSFTFETEFTDRESGERFAEHGHASIVWAKQNDGWKIVHEHVSNPVRVEPSV